MESLSLEPRAGSTFGSPARRPLVSVIISRSLWAVAAVVALIFFIAILPVGRAPPAFASTENDPSGTLHHVLVLHRHGARSPVWWYGFENEWAWASDDVGMGILTVHGMKQGFDLGQKLRAKYGLALARTTQANSGSSDPLGDTLNIPTSAAKVFSTDVDRTVDTVHSLLLGLYSPSHTAASEAEPKCACRPKHGTRSTPACLAECLSVPAVAALPDVEVRNASDKALHQDDVCKGWKSWWTHHRVKADWLRKPERTFPEAAKVVEEMVSKEVVTKLQWPGGVCDSCAKVTEDGFDGMEFIESVWGNVVCYEEMGEAYPPSTLSNKDLLKVLTPLAEQYWRERWKSKYGLEAGGILLHEWVQSVQNVVHQTRKCASRKTLECGDSAASLKIFSAHDSTIFKLLAALGTTSSSHMPGFTSHVVLELWQPPGVKATDTRRFEVRILYDDEPLPTPVCRGGRCTLQQFLENVADVMLDPQDCEPQAHHFPDHKYFTKHCCASRGE